MMREAASEQRAADEAIAAAIARSVRLSGVLWSVLGVVQILAVVTAIAGAWNIYAATSRFRIARAIEARESWVPAAFEPLGGMITMGLINLVLGGVVGVLLVGLDAWIRHRVLTNAWVFDAGFVPGSEEPSAELPRTYGQIVTETADPDRAEDR